MRLNDMLNTFINQNSASAKASETVQSTVSTNISAQIKALVPGQILQGEVLENSGDAVKLLVNMNGENVALQARLDTNVLLSLGKSLLFQVKNNGSTLSLSPLFENMGMEQNAAKALETASLPVNENTMAMTAKLMQEGISIDKSTLQEIYHEVISHQDAELMDIIDLHKLDMPVTRENLNQMNSYKGLTHQLAGGIEQMSQDLQQMVSYMVVNGREKDVTAFLRAVLVPEGENIVLPEQSALQGQKTVLTEGTVLSEMLKEQIVQEEGVPMEGKLLMQENVLQKAVPLAAESVENANQTDSDSMKQAAVVAREMSPKQLLTEIFNSLEQTGGEKEALTKLVNSDSFRANLNELLQKQMMLEPQQADKEKITELYQKLNKQLQVISHTLAQTGQESSPLGNTVQNLTQNLQFLNQMNHMYAYIQLPLKLSESNAHGELYVYSNKKHLASQDGEVSALLHLDMEHLGPVDVHVRLKESNVATQFFLRDDELLDFLYEHMNLLSSRLEKRGYQMTYSMKVRGESGAGTESGNATLRELIQDNSNIPMLANYSFDVRA